MTPTTRVSAARLRAECLALGIRSQNMSRNELVMELRSYGLYEIDLQFPAYAPKIDVTNRKNDPSNVYLGNGAGLNNSRPNQLYISNTSTEQPLIHGDFDQGRTQLNHILHLKSRTLDACSIGLEGDIVREGSSLYMYRSTDVQPGWYPLEFGSLRIV
jgi:hypothetical protein